MSYTTLRYEVANAIATVTLNRPERRNAITETMLEELCQAAAAAQADPDVRVLVLTGAGDKAFCSGADLSPPTDAGILASHDKRALFPRVFEVWSGLSKPTVARVNGHALAGGLGLVLMCDFAIAAEGAELGTPEVYRGLMPYMVLALLVRHVGPKHALEMILLGDRVSAAQASVLGLVNRTVPNDLLDSTVADFCARLASKSPAILSLGKRAFYRIGDMARADALDYLRSQLTLNLLCDDAAEGVLAFIEKREPNWKGR